MNDLKEIEERSEFIAHVDSDLEDLVPGYLDGRHEDVDAILNALENGDYEAIRILGHTMKGTGGGYGFDAITDFGKSIEIAAKEKNREEVLVRVNELKKYLDNVKIIYE